jgi:Fic family protein
MAIIHYQFEAQPFFDGNGRTENYLIAISKK